ncbi:MAG: DUF5689 domain-containing protein [Maribacter sp.]|uniref:DUF5689 domain-containing protein n=1 Tax=Maribacter sp. TaxID=1897614 RepID=UPI0032995CC6
MKKRIPKIRIWMAVCTIILLYSCVKERNFDRLEGNPVSNLAANTTYSEVKNLFQENTFQIQEDLIIEGYISSSDEMGNIFGKLHFQDKAENPSEGFQIEIDVRDSYLYFPVGSKILIKLKGLYLGKSKDVFKIGGVFTSFGNVSVGRLPAAVVKKHILLSTAVKVKIPPTLVSIESLDRSMTNTLVAIDELEVIDEELGESFAVDGTETIRTLKDCNGNTIKLLNSGFSDFRSKLLPSGKGTVVGVLLRDKNEFSLAIRSLEDINFGEERCKEIVAEFSSNKVFLCELADPDNNSKARFIELYNASNEPLSLQGWTLLRYTNDNTEVSASIDLSDFVIQGQSTFVISPNAMEFEKVYGFEPDMGVGINSPADSNGDDNLQLVDPFGVVVDVFGVIGEDGSNTNHEFEDGKAVRNIEIEEANKTYTFSEWKIYNDTGAQGTTKSVKNAPEDFNPGNRN